MLLGKPQNWKDKFCKIMWTRPYENIIKIEVKSCLQAQRCNFVCSTINLNLLLIWHLHFLVPKLDLSFWILNFIHTFICGLNLMSEFLFDSFLCFGWFRSHMLFLIIMFVLVPKLNVLICIKFSLKINFEFTSTLNFTFVHGWKLKVKAKR